MKILFILSFCFSLLSASINFPAKNGTNIKVSNTKNKSLEVKIYGNTYALDSKKDLIISVGEESIVLVDISESGMKNRKVIKKEEDLLKDVWIEE